MLIARLPWCELGEIAAEGAETRAETRAGKVENVPLCTDFLCFAVLAAVKSDLAALSSTSSVLAVASQRVP